MSLGLSLVGIDVSRLPSEIDCKEEAGILSPNGTSSSVSGKRSGQQCRREPQPQTVSELVDSSSRSVKESDSTKEDSPDGVAHAPPSAVQKVADPPAKNDSKDSVDRGC